MAGKKLNDVSVTQTDFMPASARLYGLDGGTTDYSTPFSAIHHNIYDVTKEPYSVERDNSSFNATPGVQAAIFDAMIAGGGTVYLPAGKYYFDGDSRAAKFQWNSQTITPMLYVPEINDTSNWHKQLGATFIRITGDGFGTQLIIRTATDDTAMIQVMTAFCKVDNMSINMRLWDHTDGQAENDRNRIGVLLSPPNNTDLDEQLPYWVKPGENPSITFDGTADTVTIESTTYPAYWGGTTGGSFQFVSGSNNFTATPTSISADRKTLTFAAATIDADETIALDSITTVKLTGESSFQNHNIVSDVKIWGANVGLLKCGGTSTGFWDRYTNLFMLYCTIGFWFHDSTDAAVNGNNRHTLVGCVHWFGHLGCYIEQGDTIKLIGCSFDQINRGIVSGTSPLPVLYTGNTGSTTMDFNSGGTIDINVAGSWDTTEIVAGSKLTINVGTNKGTIVTVSSVTSSVITIAESLTQDTAVATGTNNYALTRDTAFYQERATGPNSGLGSERNSNHGTTFEDCNRYVFLGPDSGTNETIYQEFYGCTINTGASANESKAQWDLRGDSIGRSLIACQHFIKIPDIQDGTFRTNNGAHDWPGMLAYNSNGGTQGQVIVKGDDFSWNDISGAF